MHRSPADPYSRLSVGYRFGAFRFERSPRRLLLEDEQIPLQPQPARALELLLARAGQLVTREQLKEHIWGSEAFVDRDQGINFAICKIRTALGDDASAPRFLETIPRAGYRFVAAVEPMRRAVETSANPHPRSPSDRPDESSAADSSAAQSSARDSSATDSSTGPPPPSTNSQGEVSRPKELLSPETMTNSPQSATFADSARLPIVGRVGGVGRGTILGPSGGHRGEPSRTRFSDIATRPMPSLARGTYAGSTQDPRMILRRPWSVRRRRSALSALLVLSLLTVSLVLAVERSQTEPTGGDRLVVAPFTTVGGRYADGPVLAEALRTEIAESLARRLGGRVSVLVPPSDSTEAPVGAAKVAAGPHRTLHGEVGRLGDHVQLTLRLTSAGGDPLHALSLEPALGADSILPPGVAQRLHEALGLPPRVEAADSDLRLAGPTAAPALDPAAAVEFWIARQLATDPKSDRVDEGIDRLVALSREAPDSSRVWAALAAGRALRSKTCASADGRTLGESDGESIDRPPTADRGACASPTTPFD